jgi:ribosomal protein S18 acetylase RimI-like enzyme
MIIRMMKSQDHLSSLEIAKSLPQWFTAKGLEMLQSDLNSQMGLIAHDDHQVLGFCIYSIENNSATIHWMGCNSHQRRKGIGLSLLIELKRILKPQGIQSLFVGTLGESVDYEPYEQTRSFYRKNGFRDYRVIKHLNNSEQEEELILYLTI